MMMRCVQNHEMPRLQVGERHEEGRRREDDLLLDALVDSGLDQRQRQLGGDDHRRVPQQQRLGHRVVLE